MHIFRFLLYPFAMVYCGVTDLRNWLYDKGYKKSRRFDFPVICVGNITVGGTGKTPFIEYLTRLLESLTPSLVSRGYRRTTSGMVVGTLEHTAAEIGDEPFQILHKFPSMTVVSDGNRNRAISYILDNVETGVVLMDDGYQHRKVEPGLNIIMCDYARPIWSDYVFPMGNLRESKKWIKRADIIIVNKCPKDLSQIEADGIREMMNLYPDQEIYFGTVVYGVMHNSDGTLLQESLDMRDIVLGVTGVGRPAPFYDELERRGFIVDRMNFSDHHPFTERDVKAIKKRAHQIGAKSIITTEKDNTRMPHIEGLNIYYIPIELRVLLGQEKKLNQTIINYVAGNKRGS